MVWWNTPLLASPTRGEVKFSFLGNMLPHAGCGTSPLVGEARREGVLASPFASGVLFA
jgi:hypothetical protein